MTCPNCGEELKSNTCYKCGKTFNENGIIIEDKASKLHKSSERYLLAIVIIIVLNIYLFAFNIQTCSRVKERENCGLGGLCKEVETNEIKCTPIYKGTIPASSIIIVILAIKYYNKKNQYKILIKEKEELLNKK